MKKILLLSLCFFFSLIIVGQKSNTQYISEHCPQSLIKDFYEKEQSNYFLNSFSAVTLVEEGGEYQLPFSILRGKDYRIAIYLTDIVNSDSIGFSISNSSGILYTNQDNLSWFEFQSFDSQDLLLDVKIPGQDRNKQIAPGIFTLKNQTGCLVVLIEEMVSLKYGF